MKETQSKLISLQGLSPSNPPRESKAEAHRRLTRREFVRLSMGAVAVLSSAWLVGCGAEPEPTPKPKDTPKFPTCKPAVTAEEKTIEAFCEVCIPGRKTDPLKKPGAVEACAVELFFDPELPAAPFVPLIVGLLDTKARDLYKKPFVGLDAKQGFRVVDELDKSVAVFAFAIQLVRLAYYSSEIAGHELGYPGANEGYLKDPNFSFRKPVSKELTKDGNLD